MNSDNHFEWTGKCPICGRYGELGSFCTHCEDSGSIFDSFDPNDFEEDRFPRNMDSPYTYVVVGIIQLENFVTM